MKKIILLSIIAGMIFSCTKQSVNPGVPTEIATASKKKKKSADATTSQGLSISAQQTENGIVLTYNCDTTDHGSGNFINWMNISRTVDTANHLSWQQVYYWQDFYHWPVLPGTFTDNSSFSPGTEVFYAYRVVWTMGETDPAAETSIVIQ